MVPHRLRRRALRHGPNAAVMSRTVPERELKNIIEAVAQFPSGASMEELKGMLERPTGLHTRRNAHTAASRQLTMVEVAPLIAWNSPHKKPGPRIPPARPPAPHSPVCRGERRAERPRRIRGDRDRGELHSRQRQPPDDQRQLCPGRGAGLHLHLRQARGLGTGRVAGPGPARAAAGAPCGKE